MLYQYNLKTEGDVASSHTIYLRADVGKHREELYARKLAHRMSMAPNELYNKAMRLFMEGQYWDAFFVFSQIVALYPDFFKNDRVGYYRGRCLQMLDMRDAAMDLYEGTLRDYPRSDIVPYAELGLIEIYYREGRNSDLFDHYLKLNRPDTPDSLREHGNYLMGETLMREDRLRDAQVVFKKVGEAHPDYAFSRHSDAVTGFLLDDYASGRDALQEALMARPKTKAQGEIIARSYLLLGYMFYEQQSLAEAITALRQVPATSYYYTDALLGQAWTGLKARQWADCRTAAQTLTRTTKDPVLKQEGVLLTAYSLVLEKNFRPALDMLQKASRTMDSLSPPSEEERRIRRATHETDWFEYDSLANEVLRISVLPQSSQNLKMIDSMHVSQGRGLKKISNYYRYEDEFKRRMFFARSFERVKSDIDYALAVVQNIVNRIDAGQIQQKMQEKTEEIDEEIERLKQQMEGLDGE
jgi:tetratricopeptide (TPR) repeat protein